MAIVAGIDIGLDGAVAVIQLVDAKVLVAEKVPTRINAVGKKVIDVAQLRKSLPASTMLTVIEYVHSFGHESRSSCFSFGRSAGRIQAMLELLELPYEEVLPQQWKAEILAGTKKDKLAAIGYATARWPKTKDTTHDGIADALCMAEYARRRFLGITKNG